uniref:Fas (TNFRSF6) associated factor 1 n=1 Tax=Astyanax mexicanus TaxID=7994 RepID=A0A8B9GX47_ASTMX
MACTGIDNIAEAIALLELNNWDLVVSFTHMYYSINSYRLQNLTDAINSYWLCFNCAAFVCATGDSHTKPQSVLYAERIIYYLQGLFVDTCCSESSAACIVPDINRLILETELHVPVSKMQLKGWKSGDVSDSVNFSVPKNDNFFFSVQQESLNQNYLLIISHREAQREYSLNFPATRTIQEVKRNISDLTNIPVRHQQWDGWPASASDDSMTLSSSGISYPCHHLTVCRRSSPAATLEPSEECTDVHMVSDSEGDDFEDASEFGVDESEIFGMGSSSCRKSPMMPENSENEGDALLHFTGEFSSRYGDCHPVFFIGSLEAASQEAFFGKARDRKLLAIYLHNDDSVLSNVFCSQMMCAESIVSYLSQNFITWAWDVTKEANKARLLTMCTRHFGSVVAQTIRTYKTDQFPLLLIVMGKRTSNEVLNVIQGNTTVDELMMRLMGAMEIFTSQQQEDIRDEDEREAREMVKREQDEAYRLSLEADRKKREAQEREEAEQVRQERIRKEQEEEREAIRLSLEQALPPEPKEEEGEPVSKLRIRTPSGEFLERRFLGSCKLQVLFDFVASKGYPSDEFKLLTTFPRRNITQLDPAWTLLEAKLFPQETLFLEAKE